MSDSREQAVVNIVIADLLARLYHYKMGLTEEQNVQRKVFLTIEEAHGFVRSELLTRYNCRAASNRRRFRIRLGLECHPQKTSRTQSIGRLRW